MITKLRNLVFITKYILIALGNMQPHQYFEDKIDVGTNAKSCIINIKQHFKET